ncbi:hypothetical protein PMAYCL1PPCAC_15560, partial [Pristionchus mayeri]
CTQIAKDHYVVVQGLQILIAVVSLFSMLPCIFIIARTGTLHLNCKALLLCSAAAQLEIIAMQLVVTLNEIYTRNPLPDDVGEAENWIMFGHEIGYGLSTVVSVYLVAERLFALRNVSDYSETVASSPAAVMLTLLAV